MKTLPDQVNGYLPVPVVLLPVLDKPVHHIIYVRKHQPRSDNADEGETYAAYAVNLPVGATQADLKHLCHSLDSSIVLLSYLPDPGNRGRLCFPDKTTLNKFLSRARAQNLDSESAIQWLEPALSGSALVLKQARDELVDPAKLRADVDAYMAQFNEQESAEKAAVKDLASSMDADGFTVVVGPRRKSVANIPKATVMTKEMLEATAAKKKRKKEKTDFYRFQLRDQKKHEVNDILRRFQDDKRRVEELRQKRRFRPY